MSDSRTRLFATAINLQTASKDYANGFIGNHDISAVEDLITTLAKQWLELVGHSKSPNSDSKEQWINSGEQEYLSQNIVDPSDL